MLKQNKRQLIFACLAAISVGLSGCGGSDSATPASTSNNNTPINSISLRGVVVDGYLQGATAFVDRNNNGQLDTDEPSDTTDADGRYTLPGLQEGDEHFPIVVAIPADAIDKDTGSVVGKAYVMTAPAPGALDKDVVVSPITTMIKTTMDSTPGADKYTAAAAVRSKLGLLNNTSFDMFADYVAGKAGATDAADFDKAHKIAQVVARAVANQMATVDAAAKKADANATLADVIALITNQVITQLATIETEVKNSVGTWDVATSGDAIVSNATIPVDTYAGNFNTQVNNQITLTLATTQKTNAEAQKSLAAIKVTQALTDMYAQLAAANVASTQQAKADAAVLLADATALLADLRLQKTVQDSYALAAQQAQSTAATAVVADTYTMVQAQQVKVQIDLTKNVLAYTTTQQAAINQAVTATNQQQADAYAAAQQVTIDAANAQVLIDAAAAQATLEPPLLSKLMQETKCVSQ